MPDVGTIAGWFSFAGVAIVAWLIWRGGGSTSLNVLETANRVLEKRVHELESLDAANRAMIGTLKTRTDIVAAVQPLAEAFAAYQTQANKRAEATQALLAEIRDKLEPVKAAG